MLDRMAEYGGGSPCGGIFYKEDAWPEKYRGLGFWAEWGKRQRPRLQVQAQGGDVQGRRVIEFIEPDKVSDFRPLDLALSYDGKTMYVADWGYGGWGNKTEKVGRVYAVDVHGEVKPEAPGEGYGPDRGSDQAA